MIDKIKLLIVEDDPLLSKGLEEALQCRDEMTVRVAGSAVEALEAASEESFDLILQDIRLPDANGLDVLKELLSRQPHCGALVMTAYGNVELAVEAMKIGAFDFLTKPFPVPVLLLKIERYMEYRLSERHITDHLPEPHPFSKIITRTPSVLAVLRDAAGVAPTNASILVLGESGTGKELFAKAIHAGSLRRQHPFVAVNCAAIPKTLIESELFGAEKGAYTGADRSRKGQIEQAAGGTLFLDEVGELPLDVQGKLLRVLQEKVLCPVGSTSFRHVDFRLISATNRNLSDMVKQREFREDLYFRLNVVPLTLPPLRERKDDIPLLIAHFIAATVASTNLKKPKFSPEALDVLYQYGYPGNIREMQNIIERLIVLHPGERILKQHLPAETLLPTVTGKMFEEFDLGKPLRDAMSSFERRYIERMVESMGGKKVDAARALGISRKVLWEKQKK